MIKTYKKRTSAYRKMKQCIFIKKVSNGHFNELHILGVHRGTYQMSVITLRDLLLLLQYLLKTTLFDMSLRSIFKYIK